MLIVVSEVNGGKCNQRKIVFSVGDCGTCELKGLEGSIL